MLKNKHFLWPENLPPQSCTCDYDSARLWLFSFKMWQNLGCACPDGTSQYREPLCLYVFEMKGVKKKGGG